MRLRHTCLRKPSTAPPLVDWSVSFNEAQAYMPEKGPNKLIKCHTALAFNEAQAYMPEKAHQHLEQSQQACPFNEAQAYMPEKDLRHNWPSKWVTYPSMRLRHTCLRKPRIDIFSDGRMSYPSMRLRHTCLRKHSHGGIDFHPMDPSMRLRHTCLRKLFTIRPAATADPSLQ